VINFLLSDYSFPILFKACLTIITRSVVPNKSKEKIKKKSKTRSSFHPQIFPDRNLYIIKTFGSCAEQQERFLGELFVMGCFPECEELL